MKELEAKLEQVKKDKYDHDIKFDEEIAILEAQLAEAKKPKLKEGDYGFANGSGWVRASGKVYWIGSAQKKSSDLGDAFFAMAITGNFDADRIALQEDVPDSVEFPFEDCFGDTMSLMIGAGLDKLHFKGSSRIIFNLEQLSAFRLKIQQIEATLKREQAKL